MTTQTSKFIASAALIALAVATVSLTGCRTGEAGVPRIICQPQDVHAENTDINVKIGVTAAGDQLDYQWFKIGSCAECPYANEVPLPNQTNNVLEFVRVQPANYGLYFCEISNHPPLDRSEERRVGKEC